MHHIEKAEIKDLLVSPTVREGIVILQGKFNIIPPVCIQNVYVVNKFKISKVQYLEIGRKASIW